MARIESPYSRVLVTGGGGFIGSELVRQLTKSFEKVIVVDNLVNGRRENLDGVQEDRFQFNISDIRDVGRMSELMRGVDIVYHLACLGVRHSIHSPFENHEVNAGATLNLLSLAKTSGVKRFVYVSSSEVYGPARWVPMTEDHPPFPMTVYGAAKLAGECYTRAFQRTYGYPTVVVRPFNCYGPRCHHEGDSGEVIPRFVLRCLLDQPMVIFGDGSQTRDFTYVSDTAKGILLAGLVDECVGETINLGSGREIAVNELGREIAIATKRPNSSIVYDMPRPGDVSRLYADTSKAARLLGFEPAVSLREGLERVAQWYLNQERSLEQMFQEERLYNWKAARNEDGVSKP